MPSRFRPPRAYLLPMTTVALALNLGCSDPDATDPDNQWSFQEVPDPFASLSAPGNTRYDYMGTIAERHYFYLGPRADQTALIGHLSPSGWRLDQTLDDLLISPLIAQEVAIPPRLLSLPDQDAHLIIAQRPLRILRSLDHGESWQSLTPPPLFGDVQLLHPPSADGFHGPLYLRGLPADTDQPEIFYSTDAGASWQPRGDQGSPFMVLQGWLLSESSFATGPHDDFQDLPRACRVNDSLYRWIQFDEHLYLAQPDHLLRLDPVNNTCERLHITNLGTFPDLPDTTDELARLEVVFDTLHGITQAGRLGEFHLDQTTASFQPRPLPPGETLRPSATGPALFALTTDPPQLAIQTTRGLWLSDPTTDAWTLTHPAHTSITSLNEADGFLITNQQGRHFRRPLLNATGWEEFNFTVDNERHNGQALRLFTRDDAVFALGQDRPTLLQADSLPWRLSTLLTDPIDLGPRIDPTSSPALGILDYPAGGVLLYSRGALPFVALPGSDASLDARQRYTSGGGLFYLPEFPNFPDASLEASRLPTTGLPSGPDGRQPSIHDALVFDDHLLVLTATDGIYRAPLTEEELIFTPHHTGLPHASNTPDTPPILGLKAIDDHLFAFSADALFLHTDSGWQPLLDGFHHPSSGLRPYGLLDLFPHPHDDGLLLINFDGVYLLDLVTSQAERIWHHDRRIIQTAQKLPSGLYLGLAHGGLWKLENPTQP